MLKELQLKRFLFVLFLVFPVLCVQGQDRSNHHKPLEYQVSVSAQLVPVFAVDSRGNPVYDLKQDEIELYVDGKPFNIIYLYGYRLESREEGAVHRKPAAVKFPDRLNFIIIDTLISNKNTMAPARAITWEMIKRASPGDAFVILESNQVRGLQYIIGPEKDKKKLKEALQKMEKKYIRRQVYLKRWIIDGEDNLDAKQLLWGLDKMRAIREREKYQKDVRRFAYSLKQLKHALKSTTLPKTVYLISAGQREDILGKNSITYLRFLEDAAKAVNYGGSLFYLINPLLQRNPGKGTALKFMADAVGGRFISGTTISNVVGQVKKNTSAYYELAFTPMKGSDHKNRIRLKCKREGVRLTTINYSEQGRPYRMMKAIEKKIFVLNIINGGSWSRMVSPVKQAAYKTGGTEKPGANSDPFKYIEVTIPPEMRNRKLHLYLVDINPDTLKASFGFVQKTVGEMAKLRIQRKKNKKQYFVFIEPSNPTCIYNRVI